MTKGPRPYEYFLKSIFNISRSLDQSRSNIALLAAHAQNELVHLLELLFN
jgi:hypothetical protein